jgi:hypothetical protein
VLHIYNVLRQRVNNYTNIKGKIQIQPTSKSFNMLCHYQCTWHNVPEDMNLHQWHCENLTSHAHLDLYEYGAVDNILTQTRWSNRALQTVHNEGPHTLHPSQNGIWATFGHRWSKVSGRYTKCTMRGLITFTLHIMLFWATFGDILLINNFPQESYSVSWAWTGTTSRFDLGPDFEITVLNRVNHVTRVLAWCCSYRIIILVHY